MTSGSGAAIERVAVLGAGSTMGLPIARNLLRAGYRVRVWNRSPKKARELAADGAELLDGASEAVQGCDAVLTLLSDADAVLGAVGDGEPLSRLASGGAWVQMSTVGLEATERCAELAQRCGVAFVDAPVLGTKQPAEAGELVVLASGPQREHERLEPVFQAIAKRTMWLGEAGAGSRLKLVVNTWVLTVVEAAAEIFALARGLGADPADFLGAVEGGPLDLPYLKLKGGAMLAGEFEPSFRLALAAKDARLAVEASEAAGLALPLLSMLRERFEEAAVAYGEKDMAAVYLLEDPPR